MGGRQKALASAELGKPKLKAFVQEARWSLARRMLNREKQFAGSTVSDSVILESISPMFLEAGF